MLLPVVFEEKLISLRQIDELNLLTDMMDGESWSSCRYFEVIFLTGIHYNGTIVKVEIKWVKNI